MTNPSRTTDPAPAPPTTPPIDVRSAPLPPPTIDPSDDTASPSTQVSEQPQIVLVAHTPRVGELSPGWRVVTVLTWIAVLLAFAAVWNASVQLGLSTWWLGPRGDPNARWVQLSPFVAPVLMVLGTINHIRWLGWWGLGASATLALYGIIDLDRVTSIAVVELTIVALAALASLASLTGTYRNDPVAANRLLD